ncbi:hypothetical protein Tco_1421926 [Tanacetum coccineum]
MVLQLTIGMTALNGNSYAIEPVELLPCLPQGFNDGRFGCERDASALGYLIVAEGNSSKNDLRSAIHINDHNKDKESP